MSTLPLLSHHVLSCRIVYWATAVVSLPYLRCSVHCYAFTRRNAQMIAVRLLLVLILRHGSGGTAEFGDGSVSALSMLFGTILTLISPLRVRSRKCLLLALFLICSTASLLNLPRTISHRNSSSAPRKQWIILAMIGISPAEPVRQQLPYQAANIVLGQPITRALRNCIKDGILKLLSIKRLAQNSIKETAI